MDAYPTPTKLGAPVTDWLQALAPAVKLAPLRMLLQNANNWVGEGGGWGGGRRRGWWVGGRDWRQLLSHCAPRQGGMMAVLCT